MGLPSTLRGIAAFVMTALAVLAAYDGFTLAVREGARARSGRVTAGVIVEKFSSTGADGSRMIGRRESVGRRNRGMIVTSDGFAFHDVLARIILTGSPNAWVINYQYGCEAPRGCWNRDFVTEALWRRLRAGQTVNVRRADGETDSSRLEENSLWRTAMVDLSIAGALLLAAGFGSERLTAVRRGGYVTAPAVVTAVESVKYRDVTRWRIRFAYFDREGAAQESADEVFSATWKPGDDCIAVFRPERPDLATFRPPRAA